MTTPNEQNYRPLGPDEVIQEGDEYRAIGFSKWQECVLSIGSTPKEWPDLEFRRPIPADPIVKEEALGGSEPIAIGGTSYCETCRNQIFPDDCCTCPSPSAPFGKCSSCGQPLNSNQVCDLCFPAEPEPKGKALSLSLSGDPDKLAAERAVNKAIVADLKEKLAESEKKRAEAEHIIEWIKTHFQTNGLTNEHSRDDRVYICGIHHVLMAAYHDVKKYVECNARLGKEIVELRARAETAERERDEARATIESIRMVVVKLDGSCSTSRIIEEVEHVILAWNKRAADAIAERDRLQAELAKCREALGAVVEMTDLYRLSPKWREMIKAALEGGK